MACCLLYNLMPSLIGQGRTREIARYTPVYLFCGETIFSFWTSISSIAVYLDISSGNP
ncbi:MAG: hypothetical protein ACFE9C_17725 [Candidatus Hodarchaeota archaeon]